MKRPRASGSARNLRFWPLAALLGIGLAASALYSPAGAAIHHRHWQRWQAAHPVFRLTDPEKDAALILDGETGKALYARNADALRHPASLTKMMTLYLLFEQLKSGQMTLATPLYVSQHAAVQARTKLYLRAGTSIPVDTAIKAIVVLSANDVAVTIAEAIGGTESHFAQMMTAKAHALGMMHTNYDNASGLPDPLQITTAADLGILARHLAYDFPQYFHYFSTYSFGYRGATFFTHDNLIGRYAGADGIKTGYTNASGFNLVSSVVRNGTHIIGVVMGGTTARRRDTEMVRLLDDTFTAIGRNPQLVARAEIPWQAIAQNAATKPVIAGFQFGTGTTSLPTIAPSAPPARATAPEAATEDEDAAESRPDPLLDAPLPVHAQELSKQETAVAPPLGKDPAAKFVASISAPSANDHLAALPSVAPPPLPPISFGDVPVPAPKPHLSVAAYAPSPPVEVSAKPRGPAATQSATASIGTDWTVQIGAFANAAIARAKLADYAAHSQDVLGGSSRIVAPFQSTDGQTLYRARFGPFPERDARQVCETLTKRGLTCFAAVAAR